MQEKIIEIASRISELRELSDIGLETMAEKLGISVDAYKQYDSGESDIPASMLFEISQILNVDMGLLLTGEEPRMHIFAVNRKGKGTEVERRVDYNYLNLASNFIHKKAEPFIVSVDPRSDANFPSMNSHPGQEFDYVISGTLKVWIHDNEIILEEGDSIYFDSNFAHAMEAVGDEPAKFLAMVL
ncbi:helix-turn-helix domain-containing protein [Methanococcoides burtonii]|uniref:Protein with helix-turn-helix and cupin domain n=1 Tax=Methanococcoides burtonii (strain DSM 6242 / NBRC 107633 / OCM 468 / ACE-M) TaxID=259564 RepID=Q12Y96_METBU|nr:XRE family transcriptional regulator [Methanococcoides burtonii]ABE51580.1 Protein with helix-turn-helix and cupin domain [Methanococcoides burtonii DSM 6242]